MLQKGPDGVWRPQGDLEGRGGFVPPEEVVDPETDLTPEEQERALEKEESRLFGKDKEDPSHPAVPQEEFANFDPRTEADTDYQANPEKAFTEHRPATDSSLEPASATVNSLAEREVEKKIAQKDKARTKMNMWNESKPRGNRKGKESRRKHKRTPPDSIRYLGQKLAAQKPAGTYEENLLGEPREESRPESN